MRLGPEYVSLRFHGVVLVGPLVLLLGSLFSVVFDDHGA